MMASKISVGQILEGDKFVGSSYSPNPCFDALYLSEVILPSRQSCGRMYSVSVEPARTLRLVVAAGELPGQT
jgi:hypothetical protein